MRVPRVYARLPLQPGCRVTLDESSAHHLVRVLRLQESAALILFNGQGQVFTAALTEIGGRSAAAVAGEYIRQVDESTLDVALALGVARAGRMDYAVQKAVELGVASIDPLLTERSAARRRIAIGACEQCGRTRIPAAAEPVALGEWIRGWAEIRAGKVLFDPAGQSSLMELPPPGPVVLLVGSEGSLTPQETGRAARAGFTAVHLGPRALRVETACTSALAAIQLLCGDLRQR